MSRHGVSLSTSTYSIIKSNEDSKYATAIENSIIPDVVALSERIAIATNTVTVTLSPFTITLEKLVSDITSGKVKPGVIYNLGIESWDDFTRFHPINYERLRDGEDITYQTYVILKELFQLYKVNNWTEQNFIHFGINNFMNVDRIKLEKDYDRLVIGQLTSQISKCLPKTSKYYSKKKSKETFPLKLFKMLEESDIDNHAHIISWLPHGQAFKIHDEKLFEQHVLNQHFGSKFKSFKRQLNLYGFQKLRKHSADVGAYFHKQFNRGRYDLCSEIFKWNNVKTVIETNFDTIPRSLENLSKMVNKRKNCEY